MKLAKFFLICGLACFMIGGILILIFAQLKSKSDEKETKKEEHPEKNSTVEKTGRAIDIREDQSGNGAGMGSVKKSAS